MGNPAETLGRIQEGSVQMIALVNRRVAELERKFADGDFQGAFVESQQLAEKLHHLAHAQNTLGLLANTYIIRARDIEAGMRLSESAGEANRVEKIEPCPCPKEGCEQVVVTFGTGDDETEVLLEPDVELVVARD